MTKLFWAVSLTLFSAILIFPVRSVAGPQAQAQDDHDDTGPIQPGYAIVTPSAPTTTVGVVEFIGLRRSGTDAIQAGLASPPLITSALMFVDASTRLPKNVGIAIVNPNAANATVTLTLRKNDGTQLATKTINIATRRQTLNYVSELFPSQTGSGFSGGSILPADFTGTLVIDSNAPISVVALRFRGLNFSTIPITAVTTFTGGLPVITTGVGGASAFLLPQFAAGGFWATEIVISNTGSSSVTVRLDLFRQDGSPLTTALNGQRGSSFTNLTIPAGGILIFAPRDKNGDDDF